MLSIGLFIVSFILMVIGLFFIILDLNLLFIGYSFLEFVYFIIRSIYSDLFFMGFILLIILLKKRRKEPKNGLLL